MRLIAKTITVLVVVFLLLLPVTNASQPPDFSEPGYLSGLRLAPSTATLISAETFVSIAGPTSMPIAKLMTTNALTLTVTSTTTLFLTATPTITATPTLTVTQTQTPTATQTPTPTATQTPTPTATRTPTPISPTTPGPAVICGGAILLVVLALLFLMIGIQWLSRREQLKKQPITRQDLQIPTFSNGKESDLITPLLERFLPSLANYDHQVIYGRSELKTFFLTEFADSINSNFVKTGELAVYLNLVSLIPKDVYLASSPAMSLFKSLMSNLFQFLTGLVPSTLPQHSHIQQMNTELESILFHSDAFDTVTLLGLLGQLCEKLNVTSLSIVLDEWSFVREDVQLVFAEVLRRVFASGDLVTLKIGGERQHTHLYEARESSIWGLQIGVDIFPGADLDHFRSER